MQMRHWAGPRTTGRIGAGQASLTFILALAIWPGFGCKRASTVPEQGLRLDLGEPRQEDAKSQGVLALEFDEDKDCDVLTWQNVSGPVQRSEGVLRIQTDIPHPYAIIPFQRDASEATLLSVRLRGIGLEKVEVPRIYWTTPEKPNGSEKTAIVSGEGLSDFFKTFHFPLCRSELWRGKIDSLRLDPSLERGVYEIDFIRVTRLGAMDLNALLRGQDRLSECTVAGETRPIAQCPARPESTVRLVPDEQSALRFAFTVFPDHWGALQGPVRAKVRAKAGWREKEIWSLKLDPSMRLEDRRWVEATIDLSSFAGRITDLTFAVDSTDPNPWGVWSSPQVYRVQKPETRPKPDIVLISVDTLRPDHLGCYGYSKPISPQLDRLASQGLLCTQATTQSSWTLPSHLSLLTGLVPDQHGVQTWNDRLGSNTDSIVSSFREAGYRTVAITDGNFVSSKWGMSKGFDVFREEEDRGEGSPPVTMKKTVDRALEILGDREDGPVFLFLHTYEVHDYWMFNDMGEEAQKAYARLWTEAPPFSGAHEQLHKKMQPGPGAAPVLSDDELQWIEALYDARISSVDQEIGRLREALDRVGNAVLAVTSDHGEEFKDRGGFGHGHSHHAEVIRAPLIFYSPQRIAPRRIERGGRSVDILPTLAQLAGVPILEAQAGVSLIASESPQGMSFSRTYHTLKCCPYVSSIAGMDWNYIYHHERDEESLYRWATDPREMQDLKGSQREALAEFRKSFLRVSLMDHGYHLLLVGAPQKVAVSVSASSRLDSLRWTFADQTQNDVSLSLREFSTTLDLRRGGAILAWDTELPSSQPTVTVKIGRDNLPVQSFQIESQEKAGDWMVQGRNALPEPVGQAIESLGKGGRGTCKAFLLEVRGGRQGGATASLQEEDRDTLKNLGYLK